MADNILDLGNESSIFRTKPDWAKGVTVTTDLKREIQQYVPGAMEMTHINSVTKGFPLIWEMGYACLDKEDEHELLDFFIDRQGRLKRFWCPYWYNSFVLYNDVSSGAFTIDVRKTGLPDVWIEGYMRFFIYTKTGDIIVRRVTAINDLTNYDQLIFSDATDRAITNNDILFFSYFALARFDTDVLEMTHKTANVSTCSVRVVELLGEYNNVGT